MLGALPTGQAVAVFERLDNCRHLFEGLDEGCAVFVGATFNTPGGLASGAVNG